MARAKAFFNKLNFILGNKPRVIHYSRGDISRFIPPGYETVLLVTCDFELAWAWRFSKEINCNLEKAKEMARRERAMVHKVLALSERFSVPITWATVGHLFLESCQRKEASAHSDMPRLQNFENRYWKFKGKDWFDDDPCCNWKEAVEWYAPDLINEIVNSKVRHEIACHTFSHIDCSNNICSEEVLAEELRKCKEQTARYNQQLKSFVFPGNFMGNLKVLKEEKITSYRVDKDIFGFPRKDQYGLWKIPTTAEITQSPRGQMLDYYIEKYRTIVNKAIRLRRLCHFWFHLSADTEFLLGVLTPLFDFIDSKRRKVCIMTMKDYTGFLEDGKN